MYILIDNYDSFTYNVYHLIAKINPNVQVFRNNKITVEEIINKKPKGIIISPGPKTPKDAGICVELIKEIYDKIPILGICLGHQALATALGGSIKLSKNVMHGKVSKIKITNHESIFKNIPDNILVTRYHSIVINKVPENFLKIATSQDKEIQAICHKKYPVYGLQFHPESISSQYGEEIMNNFIKICENYEY